MAGVVAVTDGAKTSLMKRMKEREVSRGRAMLLGSDPPHAFPLTVPPRHPSSSGVGADDHAEGGAGGGAQGTRAHLRFLDPWQGVKHPL